jgi:hypothetical protein
MKNEHRIKLPNSNTASSMIATFIATRSACLARSIGFRFAESATKIGIAMAGFTIASRLARAPRKKEISCCGFIGALSSKLSVAKSRSHLSSQWDVESQEVLVKV